MKRIIKPILAMLCAFLIVNYFLKDAKSPQHLEMKTLALIQKNQLLSQIFHLNPSPNNIRNAVIKTIVKIPIVKSTRADERKVVYYKGKKLTVLTDDVNQEIPDELLEFIYKMQLEKEKAGSNPIENNQ